MIRRPPRSTQSRSSAASDVYKRQAELATLQTQIPTDAQLSNYLRTVDELATAAGVFVLEVNPGTPQIVTIPTPVVTVAPAAEPTDPTTEATPAAPSDGTAEPAAADPAVPV